jgi:hypothetical protein
MGFKAVALDDLRQHWGGLFRAVSVQLYSVASSGGIPGNGGKRYTFSNARVQSGKWLGWKAHQVSNPLRFSKRQGVIVATDFCGEARHTKLLESANWWWWWWWWAAAADDDGAYSLPLGSSH